MRRARSSSSSSEDSSSGSDVDHFTQLAYIWRMKNRLAFMRKRAVVNSMSWNDVMDYEWEHHEECKLNGMGKALFATTRNYRL